MDTQAFIEAYTASRNGTDNYHFNPLYRKFLYSDGVKECAEAGCYWLLDILGTEIPAVFKQYPDNYSMVVTVRVKDSAAHISGAFTDDTEEYSKKVTYTDMPEGTWTFYITNEEEIDKLMCILLSEY